ncbi:uncharacterized protein Z518_05084 [Rhinocladiella mackenziei CBS 650.93]|uniref:AB hydrolase-1 domain-containing protein n=1 Tax=Rhinocladiella mackenziei CBS 650.93 TaxID=1442369 RepID=A0A0D2FXU0_9EURO|nr:uncharacterized protein Z518_05084 [Rhinocladiella mackenziei CBS 650.93]KIX07107.1 hypothetical protein Z518_05084 [Rhinocladiella mackenziei CBS 650.93]
MPYHEISFSLRINYTIHRATLSASKPRPWVILVNGLADPQSTWATQTPAFTAAGHTVLTYDNRGIGMSSRPQSDDELYTVHDMASDLHSLVHAVGVPTPFHLLGLSMGGMISQTYALTYPEDLTSATFACTYAFPGPFCSRMFSLWGDMARTMSVADVMRDVALWCFSPSFFADPGRQSELKAMEDEMAQIDSAMGLKAYLAQLNVITTFDTREEVGKLAVTAGKPRIIVLAGESDILIPVILSRELHSLIPGAQWRTTKGGHACNWEFPDEFNQTCLEMWKDVEDKTDTSPPN